MAGSPEQAILRLGNPEDQRIPNAAGENSAMTAQHPKERLEAQSDSYAWGPAACRFVSVTAAPILLVLTKLQERLKHHMIGRNAAVVQRRAER